MMDNCKKNEPKQRTCGFRLEHWQIISLCLVIYDVLAVSVSYLLALWLRFDCQYSHIPTSYFKIYSVFCPIYAIICVVVFWRMHLYNSIWRFASFAEFTRITLASGIMTAVHVAGTVVLSLLFGNDGHYRMPISYYFVGTLIQFLLVLGVRFSYRFVLLMRGIHSKGDDSSDGRVMLVGAGSAGQMILRDVNNNPDRKQKILCVIDDNPNKWDRYIDGVPVVGGKDSIMANVEKFRINTIYVAIPSATAEQKREILNVCKETNCELKSLPGIYQFVSGEVTVHAMKDVAVEDLLGRETIRVDMGEIFDQLSGKTILVTGGGGSIGSELCRQIASHSPKCLIILDIYENNAYEIEQELRRKHPNLNLVVLIGSVRDSRRLCQVFERYRPDVVYHAAAHKHVPLMETSPCEAIKNNTIGTYKTAYAAMLYGCQRFVLISTDKAVNPTNIMGASKRLCEMVIQSFDRLIKAGREGELPILYTHAGGGVNKPTAPVKTEFVAVRFGNVLGSNGSVIPLFKKQIASGGPVTVTHPDIIRYFMTIPEAVSLVLQAGCYAGGGEIFVLDMGDPVKIDTLARNLICLSGLKPDVDIKVEYTGLRPGEKLYEEKLMAEEGMKTTPNRLIHIGSPLPFETEQFLDQLKELMDASYDDDRDITALVAQIVQTYKPASTRDKVAQLV